MHSISTIREPSRSLPVTGSYDIVVAGGGIAGVAAAVAAARTGATVCLVDKMCALGGLATLGNVTVWLPICDGHGRQVIGGIAEELLRLSVRDLKQDDRAAGLVGVPSCWEAGGDPAARVGTRFTARFNPGAYLLVLEEWLLAAGVKLLYDTRVCGVHRARRRITHLIVENKSGRSALACRAVVDATGDADICHWAGEATETLDSNVASGWFYYLLDGALHLCQTSHPYSASLLAGELTSQGYRGDDADDVTAQLIESRALIRRDLSRLAILHPTSALQPFAPPTLPCLRATRRLVGAASLREADNHVWRDDAACLTGDWRRRGPVFAITLDMLCGVANHNLACAGRCISSDCSIWDCTRAIPTCAVTGEAAGTAAALAVRDCGGDLHQLEIRSLQTTLRARGNLLAPALVVPAQA